ncbi:MAG: chondroitinase family polysaccharide lyase [Paludibacteraceae bacterium]|nr:chondroitinase family polysaccharide lyase [Paludibacteraceae bacterium]
MKQHLKYIVCLLCCIVKIDFAFAEFSHPDILSFEQSVLPFTASRGGTIRMSGDHYKHGCHSLLWSWSRDGAYLSVRQPIAYEHHKTVNTDNSVYTFVFWMYLEQPLTDSVRFEFRKQGKVCCWFNYGTHFTGWRGAWLAFRRDMQGTPEEGMDELRIYAPKGSRKGQLYLDHVILSSLQDVRHHTADFQAPYINPRSESHWLVLLRSWRQDFPDRSGQAELPLPDAINKAQQRNIRRIQQRMDKELTGSRQKEMPILDSLRARYSIYHLDTDRPGLPVFFERYGETYTHYDNTTTYTQKIGDMGLSRANQLLYDLALAYRRQIGTDSIEIAHMFLSLTRHMLDQGFQAGSAMGTLHHLGYSMRYFYPAMYLMREVLRDAGMLHEVQQAMEWFSGAGEVKVLPRKPGMDIDAFNTSLEGRLLSILMIDDAREQVRYLNAFSRWVDNGFRYSDGLSGCFKPDGTIFHHCNHYPAYAVGGLTGAVKATWLLHGTEWAISRESHEILKQSLLSMRIYCNLTTWPLSLSGRHPDGKGHLIPRHFKQLAQCGSPDGKHKIDPDLQAAYLRLIQKGDTATDLVPVYREKAPEGAWSFPYSCLQVQRRGEWMVAIKGHSRYIWNTETYERCNLYGRYLNYGNIQIMGSGNPVSNFASGFRQEGWDWNRWPGTTTIILPIDSLLCRVQNLDVNSGFEEMLLSDESFCNGLSLCGNGIWGMKLHSHDKYDGTLRARKSVFCFDNRIICLGTNIECQADAPVETTLFQVVSNRTHLQSCQDPPQPSLQEHPKNQRFFGDPAREGERTPQGKERGPILALIDSYGNYYYTADSLRLFEGVQHSRHEETMAPTEGYFRTASIVHGIRPHNASYEYAIRVQPTDEEISADLSYEVLRADSAAHIVRDKQTGMTGYVLFEPNAALGNSAPCLVMTCPTDSGLIVSVADPDLHLYEGPSDETYDADGKRMERIIYSYPWKDSPSRPSTITITLQGQTLTFPCQHGMASQRIIMNYEL